MVKNILLSFFALLTFGSIFVSPNIKASTASAYFGGSQQRVNVNVSGALNVGEGDFTIEFWVKPTRISASSNCTSANDVWTQGSLIIDRDIWGPGDYGDYGIAYMQDGRFAFGVNNGSDGVTVCSGVAPTGQWTHIAAVRSGSNVLIYTNGSLSNSATLSGNLSYRIGRSTSYSNDPLLVFGAEKHAVGYDFQGYMDELRISNIARSISLPSGDYSVDGSTVALYRFENNTQDSALGFNGSNSGVTFQNDVPSQLQPPPPTPPPPAPPTQPPSTVTTDPPVTQQQNNNNQTSNNTPNSVTNNEDPESDATTTIVETELNPTSMPNKLLEQPTLSWVSKPIAEESQNSNIVFNIVIVALTILIGILSVILYLLVAKPHIIENLWQKVFKKKESNKLSV